ncbi:MAG: hypothetical protein AB7T22_14615 [Calditrichaceae bacterium]
MKLLKDAESRLSLVLWAIAVHSFLVGLGLIIQPPVIMKLFGFKSCGEHFFPAQGGVFHIVMASAYVMAASHPLQNRIMIVFSIWVKAAATIFLLLYFLIVESIWIVLASCIGDGVMGLLIFLAYRSWMNKIYSEQDKSIWQDKKFTG